MLGGGSVADPPDDPVLVEAVPEFAQCGVQLCNGAEAPQPEQLLLQGADEADRVNDFETLLVMKPLPAARGWRVPARAG